MALELLSTKTGKYMRDNFMIIKKMGLDANYILMAIFILENFHKIKNMEKVHFIGLAYVLQHAQNRRAQKFSSIMEIGGVDCLMVKANIKKQMVILRIILGDFYTG